MEGRWAAMTSRNQCQSLITSRARKKAASLEEQELVLISLMRTVEISGSLSAQLVKNTKAKLMPITAQRLAFPAESLPLCCALAWFSVYVFTNVLTYRLSTGFLEETDGAERKSVV